MMKLTIRAHPDVGDNVKTVELDQPLRRIKFVVASEHGQHLSTSIQVETEDGKKKLVRFASVHPRDLHHVTVDLEKV